jgi:preprotein translocase subunit SecF
MTKESNILKYQKQYLGFSLVLVIMSLAAVFLFRLKLSQDFTGGSVFIFSRNEGEWSKKEMTQVFDEKKVIAYEIALEDSNKKITVKTSSVSPDKAAELKDAIISLGKDIKQESLTTVGSSIGKETQRKSLMAFVLACLGIVTYIAYAFRNVPKPYSGFRFGVSAIIAMVHDALVVIGAFAILHKLYGVEIDPMFITALLTVIGFSVHDTIVVFDRIRENLGKFKAKEFEWICNFSVLETLRRSIATSLTVVITLLAMFVLGGETVRWFVFALLVGIISGTYSSIFTATPILVVWEKYLKSHQPTNKSAKKSK